MKPMTSENVTEREISQINAAELLDLNLRTQRLALRQIESQIEEGPPSTLDPLDLGRPLISLMMNWAQEPLQLAGVFGKYWQQSTRLQWNTLLGLYGANSEPVTEPDEDDRRFLDESWTDHPWFDYLKQSYLIHSDLVNDCFAMDTGLDERNREKIHFFTHQWLKAIAPSNFPATNPVVIKEAVTTDGVSLVNGYKNFLRDWEQSSGQFKILLSDPDVFKLGENIATTPGKVVYQNDLFQLIQYLPTTAKTLEDPLLVIPPWINKYYIMDLRADNSIIKYWVDQGHTVFIVSWVNPDESHADVSFEDYMLRGVYAACDAVQQATGEKQLNAVGYCIGGTLLAATLAHMKVRGDERIKSATFLTTLIDFSDPGEIRAFIDEKQVRNMESRMEKKGYLEGTEMASAFSMLRADDLIWNAVVHYYLMGKETIAFDLLHWNGDSTRMPKTMHSFYLRNMYLDNLLCRPGGITLDSVPLDIGEIDIPVYFLSTHDDHIAPWAATYLGARLFSGPVRFVVGGSGHIAGVINPPQNNKYGFRTRDHGQNLPADADEWLEGAIQYEGSWWPDWAEWIGGISKRLVDARTPGSGGLPVIEDAPGTYVSQRID
jgi:polyhydroxyalkanoate synthase